jgi:hypothetical protein
LIGLREDRLCDDRAAVDEDEPLLRAQYAQDGLRLIPLIDDRRDDVAVGEGVDFVC